MTIIVEFVKPWRWKPHFSIWPGMVVVRWGWLNISVHRGTPLRKRVPQALLKEPASD